MIRPSQIISNLSVVAVSMIGSNYAYQAFAVQNPDWQAAFERSFYQAAAIICCCISMLLLARVTKSTGGAP